MMVSAQQPLSLFRSPRRILFSVVVVIVVLMFGVCGVGGWGLLMLHHNVVEVTQYDIPELNALTNAQITLLTTQRDNRQALLESDLSRRDQAIWQIGIDSMNLQALTTAYLAMPHASDKPLPLADLKQTLTVWQAFEHIYITDIQFNTAQSNVAALVLQNGSLANQSAHFTDLLTQTQAIEQGEADDIRADALATSQHTLFILIGVSILAIVSTIVLGVSMTRHLTRIHRRLIEANRQLATSIEAVQQQNEEIAAQQIATSQANAALEVAIGERLQAEAQLVAALDESERLGRHLQIIFASVQDALLMLDADGQEIYRNRACDDLLRLEAGMKVSGPQTTYAIFSVDGQRITSEQLPILRVLKGELPDPPTIYFLRFPDDQRKVVQIEAVPIRAADGTLSSVLGVIRDITSAYREEHYNTILRSLAHQCASALTEREIAQTATAILKEGLDVPYCSIFARRLDKPAYAQALSLDLGQTIDANQIAAYQEKLDTIPIATDAPLLALRVIAAGEALFNPDALPEMAALPFAQMAFLPLRYAEETFGVLVLSFAPNAQRSWDVPDQELLRTVADEIAVALHRARLHAEAQTLAFRDPLTGLNNHRALHQRLHEALDASTQHARRFSVIMLDVDHFRMFNETYGHDIGDLALKMVAQAMQRAIRTHDVAARYGGEEFTVILPETGTDEALVIAERIRREIAAVRIAVPSSMEGVTITASLGVATYPAHASVATSLLKAADIALYAAKHGGRNRVHCYSPQLLGEGDASDNEKAALVVLPPTANLEAVQTLLLTIDLRDGYSAAHAEGVARYAAAIAAKLGLSAEQIEAARLGGLIHDVGKIAIPDSILTKAGPLTEEEWHIMRQHPLLGERCLAQVAALQHLLPIVRWHHEYLDGSGYPDGLHGAAIDMLVRIVTVANIFEAYTAERSYHPSRPLTAGMAHLRAEVAAGRLDALVVTALYNVLAPQIDTREPTWLHGNAAA